MNIYLEEEVFRLKDHQGQRLHGKRALKCWVTAGSPERLQCCESGWAWAEVRWGGGRWPGHSRSCRPWWRPGEDTEVAARTSDLDLRKGVLAAGWRLNWKERGRGWKQGDQLEEECNCRRCCGWFRVGAAIEAHLL